MGPPSVEILWTRPVLMKPRSVSRHAPMPLAGINFFHPFAHRFAGRGAVQAQVLTRRFEAEWSASAALIHPLAHVAAVFRSFQIIAQPRLEYAEQQPMEGSVVGSRATLREIFRSVQEVVAE